MSAAITTYTRPTEKKTSNREAWLMKAADLLLGRVLDAGGEKPTTLRVSCGWPSRSALKTASSTRRTLGQAWHSSASEDQAREVFISPALAEECRVLDVLLHELIHACLPADAGHGPAFQKIMREVGLAGKPTATVASDELLDELRVMAHELGRYPHEKLDLEPGPRKPGRMVKGYCPDCGTILYGSRAAWDNALPSCGVCATEYVVEPSPEQAAHWGLAPAAEGEKLENVSATVEMKTTDGRFTVRTTKTGKREGAWLVTDHEADVVRARRFGQTDENPLGVLVEEYEARWTYRRDRADALAFIAAIRSGELGWDAIEQAEEDEDFEEVDDDELDAPLTDDELERLLYLDEGEEEDPDYEDGHLDPELEESYAKQTALREASGARTSARIISGEEKALD